MTAPGLAELAQQCGYQLRVYRDTAELFTTWVPIVPSYSGTVAGCWVWLLARGDQARGL